MYQTWTDIFYLMLLKDLKLKMSGAVAKLGKPQLRGLLAKQIKTNIGVGMVLAGIAGVITNYTLCKPRRERYAEFYK